MTATIISLDSRRTTQVSYWLRAAFVYMLEFEIAEVEESLSVARWYATETVPELEQALGGLMRVREKLVRADSLGWRDGDG